MAFNLETFLEEAFVFKEDLFRSLVQLRDRDDELEDALQRVEMESASLMADVDSGEVRVPLSRAQAGRIATIRQKQKDAMQLADEKVRIATQVYDLVDSKIERLDTELKKLQREFEETPEIQSVPEAVVQSSSSSSMLALQPQGALPDVPVDPNEPKYCICNRVSFGQMVACDNPDCPREWFHFDCVGLKATPKGRWFCPLCRAKMKADGRK